MSQKIRWVKPWSPFSSYPLQKSLEIAPSDHPCKATSSSGEDPGEGWDLGHLVTLGVLMLHRPLFCCRRRFNLQLQKITALEWYVFECARSGFAAFWHGRGFSAALGLLPFFCTLSFVSKSQTWAPFTTAPVGMFAKRSVVVRMGVKCAWQGLWWSIAASLARRASGW